MLKYVRTVCERVESPYFIESAKRYCSEEEKEAIMDTVVEENHRGNQIRGTKLFKIEVPLGSRGKKGGARVIYYYQLGRHIYFVFMYSKSDKKDLTNSEKTLFNNEVLKFIAEH